MDLFVTVTPIKAGTAEPVGDVEKIDCPPDVEPDTLLSYLIQLFSEPIDIAWTYTERHPRVESGWIFPSRGDARLPTSPGLDAELLVVPFTYQADGSVIPFFELQANEQQDFENRARSGEFGKAFVVDAPQREYRPGIHTRDEDTFSRPDG